MKKIFAAIVGSSTIIALVYFSSIAQGVLAIFDHLKPIYTSKENDTLPSTEQKPSPPQQEQPTPKTPDASSHDGAPQKTPAHTTTKIDVHKMPMYIYSDGNDQNKIRALKDILQKNNFCCFSEIRSESQIMTRISVRYSDPTYNYNSGLWSYTATVTIAASLANGQLLISAQADRSNQSSDKDGAKQNALSAAFQKAAEAFLQKAAGQLEQ